MSYILNALRKSEQERQATEAPAIPVRLAATAGAGPARAQFRRPWIAAGAGAALVVAAGAAVVFDNAQERAGGGEVAAVEVSVTGVISDAAPETAAAAPEPEAAAPPVEARATSLPPADEAARAGAAAAPRLTTVAVAEPVPPASARLDPLAEPDRPEAASRLSAVRLPAGTTPFPDEPAAIVNVPELPTSDTSARVPVPSLPLANTVPPRPARAVADTPPEIVEPAPEPVAAVVEDVAPPSEADGAVTVAALTDPTWEDPSEQGPLPPVTTDLDAIQKATRFNEIGWTYERDGAYASAIDAFSRALAERPDYADAYFGRAWVNERLERLDQAIADYGWAIRLDPRFAAAHNSRGIALLYRGLYAEAARHFASAFELGDGELKRYAALWRFIAFERAGRDARAQLRSDARAMGVARWPGVLARFYLGEADTDEVLAEATTSDSITRRERLCVAYFFLGQRALLRGDQARAKRDFRAALETGVSAFAQYAAAERELVRLAALGE